MRPGPALRPFSPRSMSIFQRVSNVLSNTFIRSNVPSNALTAGSSEESLDMYTSGGLHPVQIGEVFNNRYTVRRKLGWGLYSTVWLVEDAAISRFVAMKILTAKAIDSAFDEVNILKRIATADMAHVGRSHVLAISDSFEHAGPNGLHICIVSELLGESIASVVARSDQWRLPVPMMKRIARDTLLGLSYLHDACGIIHTDIKSDNLLTCSPYTTNTIKDVLLREPPTTLMSKRHACGCLISVYRSQPIHLPSSGADLSSLSVIIADLGVAQWKHTRFSDMIQSPSLRAPEVVLGATWDAEVDIWSVGCFMYEWVTGESLFRPEAHHGLSADNVHLLQMFELLGGPFPARFLHKNAKYFHKSGQLIRTDLANLSYTLENVVRQKAPFILDESLDFTTLLRVMLQVDPRNRARASDLAETAWLKNWACRFARSDDIAEAICKYEEDNHLQAVDTDGTCIRAYSWRSEDDNPRAGLSITVDFSDGSTRKVVVY